MSLFTPLTDSFNFGQKSPSPSTSASMGPSFDDIAPCTRLGMLAPLHLTRRNGCMEWQVDNHFDDTNGVVCHQQDNFEHATFPWSCYTRSTHQPLPSLMSKFAAQALSSGALPSNNPPPHSFISPTTYLYPPGDSAIADDYEEYDLESMDIHIHETYFATSAERGRWLSSPTVSRVRSHAIRPMRGHSSPLRTPADASPLRERSSRHKIRRSVDELILSSASEDRDEDLRCSSPLPPSSPISSPMSHHSFLSDDYQGDSVVDPDSNLIDCHSLTRTPELSVSSTTCTSPVEPTHITTPQISPTIPTYFPRLSASPITSQYTNACSPKLSDPHASATHFEPDGILSPLSQFELDLPETESPKLPLSDTVNKLYPGRDPVSSGTATDTTRNQDGSGPPTMQFLSGSPSYERVDFSLNTVGEPSTKKETKKGRGRANSKPGVERTRDHTVIRPEMLYSDAEKRRGKKNRLPDHSEPPSKKAKLSHCGDDCDSRGAKSRGGRTKIKRDSCRIEGYGSCPKETGRGQQPARSPSTAPPLTDAAIDEEFHISLTGTLIEVLATSRATSMDVSALYLVLTRAHPYLAVGRSKGKLLTDIAAVLEAGRTRCGMFEKVDGSGEGPRCKVLDSRWFYVPERDDDRERASLISAIMPRQKRNETKKYKQYYYQPLDKISRWDPEDAP